MKSPLSILIVLLSFLILSSCTENPTQVLIFTKTEGYRHGSIEAGTKALSKLIKSNGIGVKTTENSEYFTEETLKEYAAVIFLSTTGDVLSNKQQADFERYIQAGGGFVGIHAATDTEYEWSWYNQLVGAQFLAHPQIQKATLQTIKKDDACCKHITGEWSIEEEWYNFKSINPDIEVLMNLDESSYEGGTNGKDHPIVWRHEFDGGRAFYTGLGHKEETFVDSLFQKQLFAGLQFAMGNNSLDYSKAKTLRIPDENRFNKQILDFNLEEPMELAELGDRGILYIERTGAIKLYEFESEEIIMIDTVDVHYADEDGLIGLAVDPDYKQNNWIYLFYSPNIDAAVQHVSRFNLKDDGLTEEKILLKIPLIRKCCHSGGSMEFGDDGLLYIGVGDNTNPFESEGYAPIDERVGRELWDAQRSASNTNDLRGKILRIKPEADGTYSIPEGNLFKKGTDKTRPEIYVMGLRNPFRFSIDSKTNYLYWGDIGPDAGGSDSLRGPEGMGEFNQAKQAGYYGWPYSRGNNQMYFNYDFKTKQSKKLFDPQKIINDSPNNTGLEELPPIQESMLWYGYKKSNEFDWMGEGGVNPMSGPIYHTDDTESSKNAFPAYFENKWFVYEWMRDWIYVVHLDENGDYVQADQFMKGTEFSHPMDMLFAKNGKLYILEYGQKWNSRNLDARLSVVTYVPGNRPPVARFEQDIEVGSAPLKVRFSAKKSLDYDEDKLQYSWDFEGQEIKSDSTYIDHTFEKPGIYDVKLIVTDPDGASGTVNKKIMVGNERPKIEIELTDRNTTYWAGKKVGYKVKVSDLEDGSTSDATLDPSKVKVTLNYIPEGEDIILASIGHQQNVEPRGLKLINSSDCKACHAAKEKVAGPSYEEIANRYDESDKENLIRGIIKGSQGVWGDNMMAAHPQLEIEEVEEMVNYILSLDPKEKNNESVMALADEIEFKQHQQDVEGGKYILMASYMDKGHPDLEGSSLSAVEQVVFRAPVIQLENTVITDKQLGIWDNEFGRVVGGVKDGKQFILPAMSLENLTGITIGAVFNPDYNYYGEVEVRLGNAEGKLLGEGIIQNYNKTKRVAKSFDISINPSDAFDKVILVFKNSKDIEQYTMNGDWVKLNYRK